jgi:hypothetical protein
MKEIACFLSWHFFFRLPLTGANGKTMDIPVFSSTQGHPVSLAVGIEVTVGTKAGFGPAAVVEHLVAVLPHVGQVVLVDVGLDEVFCNLK